MKTIAICLFAVSMIVRFVESGCGCEAWCNKNGKQYGICGDGHTCRCSLTPITDPGRVKLIYFNRNHLSFTFTQ